MTSYSSSRSWTCRLRWSWSNQPGALLGDRGDLVGDHRDDRDDEQRHGDDHRDDHDDDGVATAHAAPLEELDRRVEPGGEEERDDDQDQRRADGRDVGGQPERDQGTRGRRRSRRRTAPGGPAADRARRGRRSADGAVAPSVGARRLLGGLLARAAARSVAQDSSSPKPGDHVTQRRELGGDRVAALDQPVDLGPSGATWRSSSAWPLEVIDSAWALAAATICSASRRARVSSASASLAAWPRCSLAWVMRLAGALLGGGGALLGLLDQALGLGGRAACGARSPRGRAAPARRRAAAGPPAPRGRRRRAPARPRAGRRCAAR